MVLSINPTAAKTHAMFQAMAIQQNGQGSGGAITGNGGDAGAGGGANASASAVDTATAVAGGASATLVAPPGIATGTGAAGAVSTGVAMGSGQVAADGSCVCAVQCSFGGFPNQAMQGRDSFGGAGGMFSSSSSSPF